MHQSSSIYVKMIKAADQNRTGDLHITNGFGCLFHQSIIVQYRAIYRAFRLFYLSYRSMEIPYFLKIVGQKLDTNSLSAEALESKNGSVLFLVFHESFTYWDGIHNLYR